MRTGETPAFHVLLRVLTCAVLLAWAGCSGNGDTAQCVTNTDCPSDAPFCISGACQAEGNGEQCESDEDCEEGTCNVLIGICEAPDTCEDHTECTGEDEVCMDGVCGVPTVVSCATVDDCDVAEVCDDGTCVPFDDTLACLGDDDCPRDHDCNPITGDCEGCFNDASCLVSPHGPKCDVDTGYCHVECTEGGDECGALEYCNTDVGHPDASGGLCAPACETRADCDGGLVCSTDGRCLPCQADDECCGGSDEMPICGEAAGLMCDVGRCKQRPTCNQTECSEQGAALYCDPELGECLVGCSHDGGTDPSVCDGHPAEECTICSTATYVCEENRCVPEGGVCEPATCGGTGCGAGEVCDLGSCTCVPDSTAPTCEAFSWPPCTCPDGWVCDEFVCVAAGPDPIPCSPSP